MTPKPIKEFIRNGVVTLEFSIPGPNHFCPDYVSALSRAIKELRSYQCLVEASLQVPTKQKNQGRLKEESKSKSKSQQHDILITKRGLLGSLQANQTKQEII